MQLEILRAIQTISNPLLDIVMEGVTLFGEKEIITSVFCAIYWCADKRLGRFLAMSIGLSLCVNGAVKDFFKVERPFGAEGIVSRRLETATGYSFPSGHTQNAAAFWGGMAIAAKQPRFRLAFALPILLVGFSRMYLGVHYPLDVIGGIVIGLACTLLIYLADSARFGKKAVLLFCLIAAVAALVIGESPDTFKGVGVITGIVTGLYFEEKLVGFETNGLTFTKRLIRFSFSMAVMLLCYILPKLLLPQTDLADAARYAFLTFAITGFCPYLFKSLKL